jgi:UDP-3-O-[3-hydroxymyristoyl] glucosamine N-acyltransferase
MLIFQEPIYLTEPSAWETEKISVGAFTVIEANKDASVSIGKGTVIGHSVVIAPGVVLGENVKLDSQSFVGERTAIGNGSEVHGSKVHRDVQIGKNSFIGGEVANWTIIGNEVTFMGRIVHTYRQPGNANNWRHSPPQPSPKIGNQCVIGENALLIGGIEIGERSYVAAGEILKCNVPDDHIAIGGKILPLKLFRGFVQSRT